MRNSEISHPNLTPLRSLTCRRMPEGANSNRQQYSAFRAILQTEASAAGGLRSLTRGQILRGESQARPDGL